MTRATSVTNGLVNLLVFSLAVIFTVAVIFIVEILFMVMATVIRIGMTTRESRNSDSRENDGSENRCELHCIGKEMII
jgi:hypothetical protein